MKEFVTVSLIVVVCLVSVLGFIVYCMLCLAYKEKPQQPHRHLNIDGMPILSYDDYMQDELLKGVLEELKLTRQE